MSLLLESLERGRELEGPEEVVSLLKVGSNGGDLVNKIFNADDSVGTEDLLDDGVLDERDSGLVDLAVASLVDELSNGGGGGVSVGHVRLYSSDHVDGGLVKLDEDSVVELSESEESQDLLALGVELVDTK